jgi:nicotinamidase-related amidase
MPGKNIDLHGSAPDKHAFALLLIDVINDFDFPEADRLLKYARPMARNLLGLKQRAEKAGFFSMTLETLLRYLETQTLILTDIAGNFCVLFTANDAYMRDFNLFVPSDCTVSNTKEEIDSALRLMKKFLKADTRSSSRIVFRDSKHKLEQRSRSRRNRARLKVSIR